jgi:hypothetical protein
MGTQAATLATRAVNSIHCKSMHCFAHAHRLLDALDLLIEVPTTPGYSSLECLAGNETRHQRIGPHLPSPAIARHVANITFESSVLGLRQIYSMSGEASL